MRPELPALRNQLLTLLDTFTRDPTVQDIPEEVAEARFALVALADEMIIVSNWPSREQWRKDSLQLQLYQTNNAGDEFYDHLAALRPEQNHAREVYYTCLAVGFEGRYAGRESDRAELMRQQYEMLRAAHRAVDVVSPKYIAPPAYNLEIEIRSGRGRGLWPVLAAWATTLAAFYLGFWFILRWIANQVPSPPGS
jgi:type VI secretion system protein ImpK